MISARIISINKALLAAAKKAIAKIQGDYALLAVNQRLYVNAFLFLLIYIVFPKVLNPDLDKAILSLFLMFWLFAMSCDLLALYEKIYKTLIGKAILLLLFTVFANVALSLSAQVVNEVTGIDPSHFPHTQIILAILMIPFLIIGVGAVLYLGVLIASPLILMFHLSDDDFKKFFIPGYSINNKIHLLKITRIIQVVSFIVFSGLIYSLSQKISGSYNTFVSDSAGFLVYNMEMYSKAPCPVKANTKIAFIRDEQILVASKKKSSIEFKLTECKIKS